MGPNVTDKDLAKLCEAMRARIAEAKGYLDIYEAEIARRETAPPIKVETKEPTEAFKARILESVWELICDEGEPVRQDRLARLLRSSGSSLLLALNDLEKSGMIARDRVVGRGFIVSVKTGDGRSAFV